MKITPLSRFVVTAMVSTVFTIIVTGTLHAQPPKCDTSITACGCTIGAAGNYMLANELDASQGLTVKNGCIDIEGSDVKLTVGYPILGTGGNACACAPSPTGAGGRSATCKGSQPKPAPPSGVGIHVLPSAENVTVISSDSICGWNYAFESEGDKVAFSSIPNDSFNLSFNNIGVFLNNATHNNLNRAFAGENVTGFQISGGTGNSIINSTTGGNSQYGIWLDGSQGNTLAGQRSGRKLPGRNLPRLLFQGRCEADDSMHDHDHYGKYDYQQLGRFKRLLWDCARTKEHLQPNRSQLALGTSSTTWPTATATASTTPI